MSEQFGPMSVGLLMLMIAGVVELAKTIHSEGVKWPMVLSASLGVVMGMFYQLAQAAPTDLSGWLQVVVYSALLGVTVSGVYDLSKKAGLAIWRK
jgi:hypothetical protein